MKTTIILLVSISFALYGQEIMSYNFDIRIDPDNSTVTAEGYADVDFKNSDSINLVLWKKTLIKEINISGNAAVYRFDTLSSSPEMYIPGGSRLTIFRTSGSDSIQKIVFDYICNMKDLQGWANSFSKDWIELNYYCAWFPVSSQGRNPHAEFRIYIDDNFSVAGSGMIQKKEGYWEFRQPGDSFDNVIIASANLQSKSLEEGACRIQADYNSKEFSSDDADSVLTECRYIMSLFENSFGKNDSAHLKFAIVPFEKGGGYSRKNFVCLRTKHYNRSLAGGIAHEIAHFWWNNASASTWEDWLNESFAEYSMLMYLRDRYGIKEFMKKVNEYQADIRNAGSEIPPIWEMERNSPQSYIALYEKGSLILCELEQMAGRQKFIELLKEVSATEVSSTEQFLVIVKNKLSDETFHWLERRLKDEN